MIYYIQPNYFEHSNDFIHSKNERLSTWSVETKYSKFELSDIVLFFSHIYYTYQIPKVSYVHNVRVHNRERDVVLFTVKADGLLKK